MNIANYKILISALPVRKQSFNTKRTTWIKAEKEILWLNQLNDNLFGNKSTLIISRQDIFDTTDLRETLIKSVYWGYPRGMRGNHFVNILKHIDLIENRLEKLKQNKRPTAEDFNNLTTIFEGITGLGISTYSKLLYFLRLKFNDNPCLILDQRLINLFANKTFSDFHQLSGLRYGNADNRYLDYIQLTNQISKKLETKGENIEQFLFIFGNNLKNQK